jgi:hypothetical protein
MCGLHRFLDNRDQVLTQLAQVHFLAQGSAKRSHRFGRIILAPIEALVDDLLKASA